MNLEGDDQADRNAHGGYDKAVYAFADEDRRWFEAGMYRDRNDVERLLTVDAVSDAWKNWATRTLNRSQGSR